MIFLLKYHIKCDTIVNVIAFKAISSHISNGHMLVYIGDGEMNNSEASWAIDLLWLRLGKVGGSESFIRNLISGFQELDTEYKVFLIVARDNYSSFEKYTRDKRFEIIRCQVDSNNIKERIFFQNFKLSKLLLKNGIYKCLEPIYSIPFLGTNRVEYYTVIHDLQALHFPKYFSNIKLQYLRFSWKHAIKKSKKVVTISNYTKNDLINRLGAKADKIEMIYNPVVVHDVDESKSIHIVNKYGVEPNKYFFCVTSMMPHKNINVLLDIMKTRHDDYKLLICGVGGSLQELFKNQLRGDHLNEKVVVAPYVDDEIRDAFYQNCRLFLFPSVFEGFGMPPVEALLKEKRVITTKCTSIPEVTFGEADYVDDPQSVSEWNEKIDKVLNEKEIQTFDERKISIASNPFNKKDIAFKYLNMILGDN